MFEKVEELVRQGRWPDAEEECRRWVAMQPAIAKGHALLGLILYRQDRLGEAVPALQRALALDPNFSDAGVKLAQALDRLQRYKEALEVARDMLRLRPNDRALELLVSGLDRQVDGRRDSWERSTFLDWHNVTIVEKD